MKGNKKVTSPPRGGFALLELVLALAICAWVLVVLGRTISGGYAHCTRAQLRQQAAELAEQLLARTAAGELEISRNHQLRVASEDVYGRFDRFDALVSRSAWPQDDRLDVVRVEIRRENQPGRHQSEPLFVLQQLIPAEEQTTFVTEPQGG